MKMAKYDICHDDSASAASVVCLLYNLNIPYLYTKYTLYVFIAKFLVELLTFRELKDTVYCVCRTLCLNHCTLRSFCEIR